MFRIALPALILCHPCAPAAARTLPLRGGPEPGPYAVGYRGQTDEAPRVFEWNAAADPRSASAYCGLARAYEKRGDAACVAYA